MIVFACAFDTTNPHGGAEFSIAEWAARTHSAIVLDWRGLWQPCEAIVAQHKERIIRAWLVARLRRKPFGVALRDVGLLCPFAWCYAFEGKRHDDWRRCARMQRAFHPRTTWAGVVSRFLLTGLRRRIAARADRRYSVSKALAAMHGMDAEVVR